MPTFQLYLPTLVPTFSIILDYVIKRPPMTYPKLSTCPPFQLHLHVFVISQKQMYKFSMQCLHAYSP